MSDRLPLRNDHHVYILGAGFSRARGLPLIYDFLNRMRDALLWCEREGRSEEAEAIQRVLEFRLDAAAAAYRVPIDLENIEELFSLASASDLAITNSVKLSIAATIEYCSQHFPEPLLRFGRGQGGDLDRMALAESDGSVMRMNLYDAIASRILKGLSPATSTIISFNYDTVIEDSLRRLKGRISYGFATGPKVMGALPHDHAGTPVLKLHGSISWGQKDGLLCVYDSYEMLRKDRLIPEILPPTWNKSIANGLSEVWQTAIEKISTATRIVIVGFSMPSTDQHFKYLLAAGMKKNLSLREILFLDPSPAVRARAAELLAPREIERGRVRFEDRKVEELLGSLSYPKDGWYSYIEVAMPY